MNNNKIQRMIVILDNIDAITNSTIMCFTNPYYMLGKKEIVLSLLTVESKINEIKNLLKEGN